MMPLKFCSALFFLSCLAGSFSVEATKVSARLRGKHFADLEERARNPNIDESIRGKTLKELGIEQSSRHNIEGQKRRMNDEQVVINFFTIYDEFGPKFGTIGDTAGLRGIVYDTSAKEDGLNEEHVEGSIQGTCTVVASDGKQLCSYEIFILNGETGTIGTVIATGSISMEVGTQNILIIEATGDDFVGYKGGMVSIMYTALGSQTVMDLDLTFRR
mmetsp:Transcript_31995/g.75248  ORF Transcript_31995/g.75248 Transcript_31995/m.75248 type:complete len:216 (+) Transcript_31995:125-772(+)